MASTAQSPGRWDRFGGILGSALLIGTFVPLLVGAVAWLADARTIADAAWAVGTVVAVGPAVWWVVAALRRGRAGVDLIAVLSLIGTLWVHEYLAGALIAVMLSSGHALDAAAERRATRDLRALLERAPRTARRRRGEVVRIVDLDEIVAGDLLVVAAGEVVPTDGRITDTVAVLDESALTGEPLQVERAAGDPVRSGVLNAGGVFEMRATATADESTYAGIVRLAGEAQAATAPTVRLADRYAAWFLPLTLAVAGLTYSAGRRSERSRCWSSPHRAHCCSPHPWPSCRGSRARRGSAWWYATAERWKTSAAQALW